MAGRMSARCAMLMVVCGALLMSACAVTSGCSGEACEEGFARVVIGGEVFCLEEALDDSTRIVGLGGRESIDEHGGMIFVFKRAAVHEFVMRDCLIDIDIAYLDGSGRVVNLHAMTIDPRREGESDQAYEWRLKRYSSRYAAVFAVEVRAGTLERLGVRVGDVVGLDSAGLKQRAR